MPVGRATIFLAHSSLDIKDARQVRDLFEQMDHDVLMLKLAQQMTTAYLQDLLQNEIQARDWLVMLRSANANCSTWVGFEKHFAQERRKPVFEIDLVHCRSLPSDEVLKCVRDQVARISRDIRVFLSYSIKDSYLATKLQNDLKMRGYEVWIDTYQLPAGEDVWKQITEAIDRTLERGAFVPFLSKYALESTWVMREYEYATGRKGRVIACLVGPIEQDEPTEPAETNWVDLTLICTSLRWRNWWKP